mgnify:CR=1 FL=1
MLDIFKKVDNDDFIGKLYDMTSKYNMTYNALIVLNVIFYSLAWGRPELYPLIWVVAIVNIVWFIFGAYIGHNNEWKKWLRNCIYTNYEILNLVNLVYIIALSIAVGYVIYDLI